MDPFRGRLFPGLSDSTLFIPLLTLDGHAFWCAGKIRFAPVRPDGRPPNKCLPLVVCYEHAHCETPQIDEVDRVINFLEEEVLPGEAYAFSVYATILRGKSRPRTISPCKSMTLHATTGAECRVDQSVRR